MEHGTHVVLHVEKGHSQEQNNGVVPSHAETWQACTEQPHACSWTTTTTLPPSAAVTAPPNAPTTSPPASPPPNTNRSSEGSRDPHQPTLWSHQDLISHMNRTFCIFLAATSSKLHGDMDHYSRDRLCCFRLIDVAASLFFFFLDRFLRDDCLDVYLVFLHILSCFGSLHCTILVFGTVFFFPCIFGFWMLVINDG